MRASGLKDIDLRHIMQALKPDTQLAMNRNLKVLDLSYNNLTVIEGAFPRKLRNLALRGNLLKLIKLDTLGVYKYETVEGKPQPPNSHIRNLFLDNNNIEWVNPQAFAALPHLENVWMGGNELNCSGVRPLLPRGAACIDERCGVEYLTYIGSHLCSSRFDPEHNTAQCAYGGGDCDDELFEGPMWLSSLFAG